MFRNSDRPLVKPEASCGTMFKVIHYSQTQEHFNT